MAHILDGRALAAEIRKEVAKEVQKLPSPPTLVVILVGSDPASHLYVSLKEKAAAEVGIRFEKHLFPADVSEENLLSEIQALNDRVDVDGILVQLPLPAPLDEEKIVAALDPSKDADGFHPKNIAALESRTSHAYPPVVQGILRLIDAAKKDLAGKEALLLVNSKIFSAPLTAALEEKGMRVTSLFSPIEKEVLEREGKKSAVLVTAIGSPASLESGAVSDSAVVIDVGTNKLPDGRTVGDVATHEFADQDIFLSPVPGGVGPMTVAMLLMNTVELAKNRS